jgi:drug/metabolite transporter (DMT)-like permease
MSPSVWSRLPFRMRRPASPHAEMLLVVLFWGGNYAISKFTLGEIPPLAFTALRFVTGSLLLWLLLGRAEPTRSLPRHLWGRMLLLGLVGNTLYQLCFITGLSRTSATNTALILAAMPTFVTVASGLLGHERIPPRQYAALGLATVGVVAVIAARGLALRGDRSGDLLILGGVACWTAYTVGLRQVGGQVSALGVTTWGLLAGTPGLLLAGLPSLVRMDWGAVSARAWAGLAYSTLLSLVVAYFLWSRAVQRMGASRAALYTCASPLVASVTALVILGERPTPVHFFGGACIIGGVLLGQWRSAPGAAGPVAEG